MRLTWCGVKVGGAPLVVGAEVGSLNHFTQKNCFGAFFGPNEVLEMHLALYLDQVYISGTVPVTPLIGVIAV